ncbi:MAG TPA: hypothetical protein VNE62_05720 [Actinomycetota bacterium]|nr:hypothetical protein [Actinomycetota bacterium]
MAALPAVAAVVAVLLAVRTARAGVAGRSPAMACWTLAMTQFAVAAGCLAWATYNGWSPGVYRTYYLLGAILNVVWLALGTVWLLGTRAVAVGATAGVVALSGYAAWRCAGPLLEGAQALSSLGSGVFPASSSIVPPSVRALARWCSIGGSIVVAGGLAWSIARNRDRSRGLILILIGVLFAAAGSELARTGHAVAFGAGLAAAAIAMHTGFIAAERPPASTSSAPAEPLRPGAAARGRG